MFRWSQIRQCNNQVIEPVRNPPGDSPQSGYRRYCHSPHWCWWNKGRRSVWSMRASTGKSRDDKHINIQLFAQIQAFAHRTSQWHPWPIFYKSSFPGTVLRFVSLYCYLLLKNLLFRRTKIFFSLLSPDTSPEASLILSLIGLNQHRHVSESFALNFLDSAQPRNTRSSTGRLLDWPGPSCKDFLS